MFCPNCGSKNDDKALRCAQCGFELQAKKQAPRFKGTMVMQVPSPAVGASPSPKPLDPGLKGTMVGVAPPGLEDVRRQIAEAAQAGRAPAIKGTMLGVAPSDSGADPALPPTATQPSPVVPTPKLKGTMLGVAPPDVAALRRETEQARSDAAQEAGSPALGATIAFSGTTPEGTLASPAVPFQADSPMDRPPAGPPSSTRVGASTAFSSARTIAADQAALPPPGELGRAGPRYPAEYSAPASPPKTSNTAVVILIVVVLAIAAALLGIGLAMRGAGSPPPSSGEASSP